MVRLGDQAIFIIAIIEKFITVIFTLNMTIFPNSIKKFYESIKNKSFHNLDNKFTYVYEFVKTLYAMRIVIS